MNNKELGTEFENEFVELLNQRGFWAHFIVPNKSGGQPFDVIAVKSGVPYAIDCKTSARKRFPVTRLEDNQILAFEKWLRCGNGIPLVAVKFEEKVYMIPYTLLHREGTITLCDEYLLGDELPTD